MAESNAESSAEANGGIRRGARRDSIMIMGSIKAFGDVARPRHQIRIRNLSATGLMADSQADFDLGSLVEIELRGIGVVAGEIVWIRDNRMGVAFTKAIDPELVRKPVASAPAPDIRRIENKMRRPGLRML